MILLIRFWQRGVGVETVFFPLSSNKLHGTSSIIFARSMLDLGQASKIAVMSCFILGKEHNAKE